jgi:hypothetical protein
MNIKISKKIIIYSQNKESYTVEERIIILKELEKKMEQQNINLFVSF